MRIEHVAMYVNDPREQIWRITESAIDRINMTYSCRVILGMIPMQ